MEQTVNRMRRALARGLADLGIAVRTPAGSPSESTKSAGVPFELVAAGRTHKVRAMWAGEGWPADVRAVLGGKQLQGTVLVVARDLSPGAIEVLRDCNANYVDESGRVHIVSRTGLYVEKEPLDRPKKDEPKFVWSRSALACAEVILTRPERALRADDLVAATGWSSPQVSSVLRKFDVEGWTRKEGAERGRSARRELADVDALLKAWAIGVGTERRNVRYTHGVLRDPMAFLRGSLATALRGFEWAVTGWAALEMVAPFATAVPTLQCYVERDAFDVALERAIRQVGLRDVEKGARVEFVEATRTVLSLASGAPIAVVGAPRLFADLLSIGGRGEAAAEHVRETLLAF